MNVPLLMGGMLTAGLAGQFFAIRLAGGSGFANLLRGAARIGICGAASLGTADDAELRPYLADEVRHLAQSGLK